MCAASGKVYFDIHFRDYYCNVLTSYDLLAAVFSFIGFYMT